MFGRTLLWLDSDQLNAMFFHSQQYYFCILSNLDFFVSSFYLLRKRAFVFQDRLVYVLQIIKVLILLRFYHYIIIRIFKQLTTHVMSVAILEQSCHLLKSVLHINKAKVIIVLLGLFSNVYYISRVFNDRQCRCNKLFTVNNNIMIK